MVWLIGQGFSDLIWNFLCIGTGLRIKWGLVDKYFNHLVINNLIINIIILTIFIFILITVNYSVRVSNELGAGHPKAASFAVIIANLSSLIISVILAVVVLLLRHVISYAFTSGTAVAGAVAELSPFLAASVVLGGVQPVLSGRSPGN